MSYMPPSKTDVHITPKKVWEIIKQTWNYEQKQFFDPCPVEPKFNGLEIKWKDLNFVNPPYSKEKGQKKSLLTKFVEKALQEDGETIMLLPSKTDQEWFHKIKDFEIVWIRGRLKFTNNKFNATQPHFLVRIGGVL